MNSETIRAYLKLLRHGKPVGVRSAQKILGYRSPGKAQRVLERLAKNGLARRNEDGKYEVSRNLPPLLASYMTIKGAILPRIAVYTTFITALTIIYTLISQPPLHIVLVFTAMAVPYWLETINLVKALRRLELSEG